MRARLIWRAPILSLLELFNGDDSVTLTYAVTPGFPYRIETATNLFPAAWTTVAGSATNPAVDTVTFTDLKPPGGGQRYYRTSSP